MTSVKKSFTGRSSIVYDQNFELKLKANINIVVSKLPLKEPKEIKETAIRLYEHAIGSGLKPSHMGKCKNSGLLSIILVYYGLLSLGIENICKKKNSTTALLTILGDDIKIIGLSKSSKESLSPYKFYPFLPEDIKKSIEDVQISRKPIVFNTEYYQSLKKYIIFVASHLPISEELRKKVKKGALFLYDYAIENGLKPSNLKESKNSNYFSIILVYYSLVSLKIHKLNKKKISKRLIWDSLGQDFRKLQLSKTSYSTIHPKLFVNFLPERIKIIVENKNHPHQLSYNDITLLVESLNYTLKTEEKNFIIIKKKDKTMPSYTTIKVKCNHCGYEWDTKYYVLLTRKNRYEDDHITGCNACNNQLPKTYEDIWEYIDSQGGILITSKNKFEKCKKSKCTVPVKTTIKVRCKKVAKHEWNTTHDNVRTNKYFCPYCSHTAPLTYEDIKEYVKSRGAVLLTSKKKFKEVKKIKKAITSKTEIKICSPKCKHTWYTTKDRLSKSWCPECKEGKYEKILRWYLENIFSFVCGFLVNFPKVKLYKLIDCPDDIAWNSFNKMHYDYYNKINILGKVIRLAVEFNGPQHYIFPNHIHPNTDEGRKKFNYYRRLDEKKERESLKNCILLIIFPNKVDKHMSHPKRIQDYIVKEFKKKTGIDLNSFKLPQFDHRFPNSPQKTIFRNY